jgi:phosphoserine phosphatase
MGADARADPVSADGARPASRGAAFFDLDKTLMEGSSAFQFAKAAYAAGQIGRRQLASDGWANLRYRLRGASDADSLALRNRIATGLAGRRVVELERIAELAEREGIDLTDSYAYSDSISDLPMLEAVGHPVAVNPDGALRRIAREAGWEIMLFDRLRRRLTLAATLGGAAAAGGVVVATLGRARYRPRPRFLR